MTDEKPEIAAAAPPRRVLYAAYGAGLFGIALTDIYALIIPLLALSLGSSPTEVGLLIGARSILPLFLSIHGGALMDRLGSRRVTLFGTAAAAVMAVMFPSTSWFPFLLLLQAFSGLFLNLNWIGAQTLIAQVCHGDAVTLGRFNFVVRGGTIAAPVIAGALWDFGGAWPTFLMVALCALSMHMLVRLVPEPDAERFDGQPKPSIWAALPRIEDYTRSFAIMVVPVIAFTVIVSGLRNGSTGIQTSLYVVYLEQLGYQGTMIGVLFSALEITIGLASLVVGAARKLGRPEWVLLGTTVVSIATISVTPLLGGVFLLMVLMQMLRGVSQGLMQPLMFSIQSAAAGRENQGAVVGLRITANRVCGAVLPPIMGFLADHYSIEASFLLTGLLLLIGCAALAALVIRKPEFRIAQK
ncbi:MAG TPA: MFS transporter [Alphaproteobacteria bacterium]